MQKRILFIFLGIATTALFIFGAYYVAVFLPQKQKLEIEKAKLELEAKIEQEKTEQARIEKAKQQAEEDERKRIKEEASEQAQIKQQQQKTASSSLAKCLDNVDVAYKKAVSRIAYPSSNGDATLINLGNQRNQLRSECYK